MIVPALALVCGPIGWAGIACCIAGEYRAGMPLLAASWALALGMIFLAWRANIGGRHGGAVVTETGTGRTSAGEQSGRASALNSKEMSHARQAN